MKLPFGVEGCNYLLKGLIEAADLHHQMCSREMDLFLVLIVQLVFVFVFFAE